MDGAGDGATACHSKSNEALLNDEKPLSKRTASNGLVSLSPVTFILVELSDCNHARVTATS